MAELRRFIQQVRAFTAILNGRGLVTYAASCAFYSFLSLFPIAALAAALVPCAGISRAALLHLIHGFAPDGVAPMLQAILLTVYSNVFPALPLSLLALLWSAAKALSELLKGMAAMTGADASVGYFRRRLRAVWLIGAMLTVFLLSLGLLVFGVRIALLAERLYPSLKGWLVLILRLRHVVMALLLWLLFALLYRSIPGLRLSFRETRNGAAFSAGAWILFSFLFSLYTDRYMNLSLYGSMAALALTMLWLFYCQHIILIGTGICVWPHTKKKAVNGVTASP